MDNLTHSLIGALIGQTGLKKLSGLGMPTLIIAANIPDIDAACFFWLEGTEHLGFRRGITHGPLAMLLLPLLLTAAMVGFDRWQTWRGTRPAARPPVRFGLLYLLALIGTLSHPAFDWLNNYGVRLLEPFSSRWSYGDSIFIIDVWMWAILIGGLLWSRRAEKNRGNWRQRGQLVATFVGLYVFANGAITSAAEQDAALALAAKQAPNIGFLDWRHGSTQQWDSIGMGGPENWARMRERPERLVVASPRPLLFWQRDVFWRDGDVYGSGEYSLAAGVRIHAGIARHGGGDIRLNSIGAVNSQVKAFLFWSRMPVARWTESELVLTDQRYEDPRVAERFTIRVPRSELR